MRGNITRVICAPPLLPPLHHLAFLRFPRIRSWLPGNVLEPQSNLNFKYNFEWLTPADKSELQMFLARKHNVEVSMLCRYAALSFVYTSCFALRAFVRAEASEPEKSLMYTNDELNVIHVHGTKDTKTGDKEIKMNNFRQVRQICSLFTVSSRVIALL